MADSFVAAPNLDLLFRVTYPRYRNGVAFIILFVAQVITALKDFVIPDDIAGTLLGDVITDIIPYSAIIGPVITTLTLFFIFRNLPAGAK